MHTLEKTLTQAFGLLLLLAATAVAQASSASTCRLQGMTEDARCSVFDVPENPATPGGRRLKIHVAVLPATGAKAAPDPIVVLMGGPGEDTIAAASDFAPMLASLRDERDVLLVDQRGTGQSGALSCRLFSPEHSAVNLQNLFPVEALRRCERELSARADLRYYTFANIAADLEHVRQALGYGPLNLSAGSYGTRYAQVYMRMYPKSVRTAYLGSVVPLDIPSPLPFAKTADKALEGLLSTCAADAACQKAFPNLRDEFQQVRARLESGAVRVSIPGRSETVQLPRGRVAEWFRSRLYRPAGAATLPWLIHQASGGNWNPVVDGILEGAREIDGGLNFGLFFSITCNEDVAFLREGDVVRESQGTFLGDYRIRQQQSACQRWPKASLPANYRAAVSTTVPTMFVSGDADGGTPLWYTNHVAKGFSQRVEVVARGQGHTEWSECVAKLYERFVRSGTTRGLEGSTCEPIPRPPFKTG